MTDKSISRTRRSGEELAAAWERLLFEIKMLFGAARALHNLASGKSDERRMWAVRNALLESFSGHASLLLDVLYPEQPMPDDVLADDFFDRTAKWMDGRPAKSQLLSAVHGEADRGGARLSFARLDGPPELKLPDTAGIARDLRAVLRAFLSMAPARGISDESRLYALSIMADEIPDEGGAASV